MLSLLTSAPLPWKTQCWTKCWTRALVLLYVGHSSTALVLSQCIVTRWSHGGMLILNKTNQPTNPLHLHLDWHPLNLGFCFQIPVCWVWTLRRFAAMCFDTLPNLVQYQVLFQYGKGIPMMNQALIFDVGQENKNKVGKDSYFSAQAIWMLHFPRGVLQGNSHTRRPWICCLHWLMSLLADEIQWNYRRWN